MRELSVHKNKLIATGIILLAAGLVIVLMEIVISKSRMQGPFVFENLKPEEIRGNIIVEAAIDTNFGSYMEEYAYDYYGFTTVSSIYYVIWTGDAYSESYKYMGIKVPSNQRAVMDKIAEATYEGSYVGEREYTGVICMMGEEEYQYFKEYFQKSGLSEEEIEEKTIPYYINLCCPIQKDEGRIYLVFVVAGAILFLIGVWKGKR